MIEEEDARVNKLEHAKFLLYQIQQELSLYRENKDCIVQCEDGSLHTSASRAARISSTWRRGRRSPGSHWRSASRGDSRTDEDQKVSLS